MMYCLRSYLPLLLLPLPLSLSPIHLTTLLILTYFLNRPCIYCSFLLIILFASSCHWSNRCFVEFPTVFSNDAATNITNTADDSNFNLAAYFIPRLYSSRPNIFYCGGHPCSAQDGNAMGAFLSDVTNSTLSGLAAAARDSGSAILDEVRRKVGGSGIAASDMQSSAGIGTQWLKNLLGRSEWTLPCLGVKIAI